MAKADDEEVEEEEEAGVLEQNQRGDEGAPLLEQQQQQPIYSEHAVQQVQQPMPVKARQAAEQAQQDLCVLLLQATPSAAAAAAGLTPELAASFVMLMHKLPTGERAEKEALLRTLLAHGLYAAAAQAMTTALVLRSGHAPAGPP
ncbi:hypothetical protein ABPG77_011149 [Micractinium sp. CCAP 211/92]